MQNELISVIVPIYNGENYIEECIASILKQSYQNLEVILINDGSSDNSGDICDNYAKHDCRVKVIHKENGGASSARNAGLDVAKGEFVAFVDSDDHLMDADMYKRLHKRMTETGADICVCGYKEYYTDYIRTVRVPHENTITSNELWEAFLKDFRTYASIIYIPWNKLFRMSLLQAECGKYPTIRFNENLIRQNDVWFTCECCTLMKNGITFVDFTPYAFMPFNNPESLSKTGSMESRRTVLLHLEEIMVSALPHRTDEIKKAIKCQIYVGYAMFCHRAIVYGSKQYNKLSWEIVSIILRYSKNKNEKASALMMFFLPGALYRMAFKLYCKIV